VVLRSALRPPLRLRPSDGRPLPEPPHSGALWELPAGLVEQGERSEEGLRRCAARELLEETGYRVEASAIKTLGPPTFPAPSIMAERQFFFHVEIDPARRGVPSEDGSVLERHGRVVAVPLDEALELARQGALDDAKTELGLRRLAEA
jgi:ADP-ribose pyrophosphatase